MKFEKSDAQYSGFPANHYPNIFHERFGTYNVFGIRELYLHLFTETVKGKTPFITFPEKHTARTGEDLLQFLMPEEMFEYIKAKAKPNDYKEFLLRIHKNNKITKFIHEMFYGDSEAYSGKMFGEAFRRHYLELLKNAEFSPYFKAELENFIAPVIVPGNTSSVAYEAFRNLIDKNTHNAFATAVANIFASAILGLFAIKHPAKIREGDTEEMKDGYRYSKTYVLNDLGMQYIWAPEKVTTSLEELFEAERKFNSGDFETAEKDVAKWFRKHETNAQKKELAKAYRLYGLSLFRLSEKGARGYEGKEADSIALLEKCIATGEADASVHYFLYEYHKAEDTEKASACLKTAFEKNYAEAVIEVAFSYIVDGKAAFEGVSEEDVCGKINDIIENEFENEPSAVGRCLYLRGKAARNNGRESDAQKDFEAAAKKGNERAKQELNAKERKVKTDTFPTFSDGSRINCCFANTISGNNYEILSTFPDNEWALFAPIKTQFCGIQYARNIDEFIRLQHIGEFEFSRPGIVFLFMSEDEKANLSDCLILLDKLFNIVLDKSEEEKLKIIDAIDIFVGAGYETASMLISANLNQMGSGTYFKVHIADENRDVVHKLLCDAPLFLPALNGAKSEYATKVVLFGSSEMNYCFVKEAVACAYLGADHPIDITLLGEDADILENRFRQECPGIFGCTNISCIRPKFISCNIQATDFPTLINNLPKTNPARERFLDANKDLAEVLMEGNYFIVDYSDDLEDIRFAMELRTWLLRSRDSFDRTPFIAVRTKDKRNSYLTGHLTLSGQAAGTSYYNKYDLFPFGLPARTYHYSNIIGNPVLHSLALQIHKFYYLSNDLDKKDDNKLKEALEECRHPAENDFYSYSYNADSSISTAIGLCYRFFAAGSYFADKEDYPEFGMLKSSELRAGFDSHMNSEIMEKLARIEQSRWNSFMLIRGWLPADIDQVRKYEAQASGSAHKHNLAKLHPFIREWDDLNDPELEETLGILKEKAGYNKKPQLTTRKSIEDTTRFFVSETREIENEH